MIKKIIKKFAVYSGPVKVIVRDVGHGNWNEIRFGNVRIFFDIGASKYMREKGVEDLVKTASIHKKDEIYILLSHWDMDHYHSIKKLSGSELKQIKGFIAPQSIPKTNTAMQVRDCLKDAGVEIDYIPFTQKISSQDRKIELNLINENKACSNNILRIYRSTKTSNRNLDSIVIYLETSRGQAFNRILASAIDGVRTPCP